MNNTINMGVKIAGEYNLVITRGDGTVEETGWFHNLILDQGLDRIGSSNSVSEIARYVQVGSGNIAPAVTQVALQTFVAGADGGSSAVSYTNEGSPLYATLFTYDYAFGQGAVVGNITEVGIGWAASGSTLFSRALILDNLGVPTSITLVAIDQLTVFYRLKLVPPLTDTTSSVTISSTTYNYTGRVSSVGSFAVWPFAPDYLNQPDGAWVQSAGSVLGPITGSPTGGTFQSSTVAVARLSYSPGTYYRDSTFSWPITQGNVPGGIQCIIFIWVPASAMRFQYRFDTPIPKTNTRVLTMTVRLSWARV